MRGGLIRLSGGFRLDQFASFLSGRTVAGLPVRDQTNLDGMFDISFTLNPGPPRGGPNPLVSFDPPLPQALEEQLGLKLEPRKVPVEVIVVDHVEEPSAN